MRSIRSANHTVALCYGDHVLLAPSIAALEPEHPTRRFVSMLCIYSAELDALAADGVAVGFSGAEAEGYARRELMPDELFEPLLDRADYELAEHFVVPLEQIGVGAATWPQGRSPSARLLETLADASTPRARRSGLRQPRRGWGGAARPGR